MSDQPQKKSEFPANWQIAGDYDPNEHLMNLKGREYLNVQNRMIWFLRDQRAFVVAGLAEVSYIIRTELVEMDREAGFAHYKTYIRDVLGNEATMYGSETQRDFGDYAEKASTKSLGRALLCLGYGTAFAPEMDEGDRVVDAPIDAREPAANSSAAPTAEASSPADEFALKIADPKSQSDLALRLKKCNYDTPNKADPLLRKVTGRTLHIKDIARGESEITMAEIGKVLQQLDREAGQL
jgi:hypothetical protein